MPFTKQPKKPHEQLFDTWAHANDIIAPWRSMFDGVRQRMARGEDLMDAVRAEELEDAYPVDPRIRVSEETNA